MSEEKLPRTEESARLAGPEKGNESVPREEVDKLYREMKRWKERCRKAEGDLAEAAKRETVIDDLTAEVRRLKVSGALRAEAERLRAIDPDEIAGLLEKDVALGDDLEPVIKAADAGEEKDSDGREVGIGEYVAAYLAAHPHHVRPAETSGGGTAPRAEGPESLGERLSEASTFDELSKIIEAGG